MPGKGSMMIKIDIEKAYDRLCWPFIRDTLACTRIPMKWVNNIMHCVESSKLAILWNGKRMEWFKPTRGIRQGDAISPYLFVLCMERLGHIIYEVVLERWKHVQASRNGPKLLHLFFADDLISFAEALVAQIKLVMDFAFRGFVLPRGKKLAS